MDGQRSAAVQERQPGVSARAKMNVRMKGREAIRVVWMVSRYSQQCTAVPGSGYTVAVQGEEAGV